MKRRLVTVAATLVVGGVLAAVLAAVVVLRGLYDVGATTQHTQPVYTLLKIALTHSVRQRAADIDVPPLGEPARVARGAACYQRHCEQCHGGPGVAPGPVGASMQPLPGPLVDAARHWHERELYWITRHGIRMTGMPAWGLRLADDELWAVVAFLRQLPLLTPVDYRQAMARLADVDCPLTGGPTGEAAAPEDARPVDAAAQLVMRQYACVACHRIPGVTGDDVNVGPPLHGMARRRLIAGRLPNTPENMMRWIRAPQEVKPGTAMPDLDVTDEHARLITRYLARLH